MALKGFNAYKMAQEQFEKVAEQLELDQTTRNLLKVPMREYHFLIPVVTIKNITIFFIM